MKKNGFFKNNEKVVVTSKLPHSYTPTLLHS